MAGALNLDVREKYVLNFLIYFFIYLFFETEREVGGGAEGEG